ncbi:hypothetical protein [Paractinoplanes atraurantiacus]|uniref:Uncharacterized protein n=1 Tax=Paractinoplanes atraurantiacus TaxID=1036182 RepID=A0A285KGW2_9ACTN|nr:hypothetical protein [Actinoplanes atraurantiacus]SNY71493.1 hypothetical protein SAMN05421748_14041 [Actinoplanes atraurantiacus]
MTIGPAAAADYIRLQAVAAALARRRPDTVSRRTADAILDLLHDRPAEAQRTLLGISPSAGPDAAQAALIRAIAQAALHDHAQADRLVNAVNRAHMEAGTPGAEDPAPVLTDILAAHRARTGRDVRSPAP